ncbi:hypothetical protein G9A89_021044 [Geosiphon pyriformis]|nr:hypothetical protein G9A89_021044 [Geosiphon pyriformis]
MPEEQDFHHTALSEGRAAAQQQNFSYTLTTIPPARIAENANLSDIFPFEFEANESPFLLSNAVANKQKAITAMYTEAEAEKKPICLILNTQTIIVTADGMKKTPIGKIDNFPFTIDRITIPVKVLIMDVFQYQALVRNDWLQKANANLNWKTQELTISYQGQHAWADKTEQQYFSTNNSLETKEPVTPRWNVPYSKPEPRKQPLYIPLKCKDCHKKLSSMGACISPEEEYGNHTCYYCKSCH